MDYKILIPFHKKPHNIIQKMSSKMETSSIPREIFFMLVDLTKILSKKLRSDKLLLHDINAIICKSMIMFPKIYNLLKRGRKWKQNYIKDIFFGKKFLAGNFASENETCRFWCLFK